MTQKNNPSPVMDSVPIDRAEIRAAVNEELASVLRDPEWLAEIARALKNGEGEVGIMKIVEKRRKKRVDEMTGSLF